MNDINSIRVIREGENNIEVVDNPTSYPLIGTGKHGAVFKISSDQCVKIYTKPKNVLRESEALKNAQDSPIVPKLYEVGDNYIIMEFIEGPTLLEHLQAKGNITQDITQKILSLILEMKRLNFVRVDPKLKQVIVTKEEEFRVIDHVFSYSKKKADIPVGLLAGLSNLGLLSTFLEQVKLIDPESYEEWRNFKELEKNGGF
ncbi:RIO-like serine/threonine protein kinase [Neobacillus niacini]|uniref:AarF/UbiB family protein n=1 Tax=Neobacillus niacini TaxID=86668 RepID=UPI0028675250|nr:AarF/UbiB family protein [Neobacillus niacini]MDR7080252.1 RIO-like serine/threonine protein kinase [Neobacillus niacini]